ncbi:MAG: peptidylprolyl isomerase [Bdellovibrionaceae bacterium]|nr:peptidylprolyl isomerase [Pseudobdellovibrionaceae bacterium]MDW8190269.1 peptidylprolyl isomerase [Pseudobdellovibrionaceae bacterium]
MGQILLVLVGVALGFLSQSCTRSRPIDPGEKIALVIGDKQYSLKELSRFLAVKLIRYDLFSLKNAHFLGVTKNRLIADFILKELILLDAAKLNISVSEQELQQELDSIKKEYPDELLFKEALIKSQVTEPMLRQSIKDFLIAKKFFSHLQQQLTEPTEEECRQLYRAAGEEHMTPERVLLRQILVKEKHQAEELHDLIQKKKITFEEAARTYSLGPEASQNGLIGWIDDGQVDIFKPAFKTKPGKLTPIISSSYGYHIVRVEAKMPSKKMSFEEALPKIKQKLLAEQEQGLFLKWLDEKLRKVKIKKSDKLINSLKIETRGS